MKLRIKGNSLRLRVSPSEMSQLLESGRVEETIQFGPQDDARLTYALLTRPGHDDELAVRYLAQQIVVEVPSALVLAWSRSEQIGIYGAVNNGSSQLDLAVEKDFACLDKTDVENRDTYPNPNQGAVC